MSEVLNSVRTTCPYCGVGCGVLVTQKKESKDKRVIDVVGDSWHPANRGHLCAKGRLLSQTLETDTRVGYPQINGQRVSWSEATQRVASAMTESIARHGKDSVAFYVSGQFLSEDYYVANKLMKGFIGSANIDSNSRLCMSSPVVAQKYAFGSDCVPVNYRDLELADLVVIVGSNLAHCHPILHQKIRKSKAHNPEKKVVVIDPRETATCELADLHLSIRSGADLVLFNQLFCWLAKQQIDAKLYSANKALENYQESIQQAFENELSMSELTKITGIQGEEIEQFFGWFLTKHKVVTIFSQGINQSEYGSDQANAIINCHLLCGKLGYPGAGPFPVTGQPNAMGGREVGALATSLVGHAAFDDIKARGKITEHWNCNQLAKRPGLTAVEMFEAAAQGKIKVLWIMATNPVVSLPDTAKVKEALKNCPLVIVSEAFATSETLEYADIVLPAAAWGEKSGTVTNSERRVSRQRAFLKPFAEAKADWQIICEVAKAMGYAEAFNYSSPFQIFKEHTLLLNRLSEEGGELNWQALEDLTERQYQQLIPWQWPQKQNRQIRLNDSRPFSEGRFDTPSGRARLAIIDCRAVIGKLRQSLSKSVKRKGELILNTGRIRDQWHTLTRTRLVPALNLNEPGPVVVINPATMQAHGLKEGDYVTVIKNAEQKCAEEQSEMRCLYVCRADPGVPIEQVFIAMHWHGQTHSEGSVNHLIKSRLDNRSLQPAFKQSFVRLCKVIPGVTLSVLTSYSVATDLLDYWREVITRDGKEIIALWSSDASLPENISAVLDRSAPGKNLTEVLKRLIVQLIPDLQRLLDKSKLIIKTGLHQELQIQLRHNGTAQAQICLKSCHKNHEQQNTMQKDVELNINVREAIEDLPMLHPDNRVLCACNGKSYAEILQLAEQHNLKHTEEWMQASGAGLGCGSCIGDLDRLRKQLMSGRSLCSSASLCSDDTNVSEKRSKLLRK